jgi:hypothetical protein
MYVCSVLATTILGCLITIGYALIIFTNSVTEIPLVIQQVDDEALAATMNSDHVYQSTTWQIWGVFIYGLISASGFIGFHVINFKANVLLYLFVFFGLNVPIGLKAFRVVAKERPISSSFRRKFAIVYDLLIVRNFLRNHVILTLFCFLVIT